MKSQCNYLGVMALTTFAGCTEGDIRLIGRASDNTTEGRVEICLSNEWGTVCDQLWDETDAGVICRQLGLSNTGNDE